MAQLTIKLSDKGVALIAQLQKEIFNRRRKKVTTAGVVETLIESGAKSQSDKRFAASWQIWWPILKGLQKWRIPTAINPPALVMLNGLWY